MAPALAWLLEGCWSAGEEEGSGGKEDEGTEHPSQQLLPELESQVPT